ncbi:MAG TPA: ROK family transcriptional regulator [Actinomycetes bacterium]|nr:ROK family transcriptional regulator [Actinomycetes bacterium]
MTTARSEFPSGTPSLLRSLNARTVLELIRRSGPISRAQIARDTGLSKPTVSLALNRLVGSAVVREVGRSRGGKGPAAVLYQVDPRAGSVVGIDVGRGWIRAAVADLSGVVIAQRERRSTVRSAEALLERLGDLLDELLQDAGVRRDRVTRWVLGTPGIVRPGGSSLDLATNLPGWGKATVLKRLRELLGDVVVENDVNLATMAEHRFGHGRGVDDFVVVSIGTGVGMGLVLGGRLYRGATGAAGEIGYLPICEREGRKGHQGLLESATGAAAVVRDARESGMTGRLTAERVFDAARSGDPIALSVVDAEAERIGLALAAVASVVDPSLVVLGGGIGGNADLLRDGITRRIQEVSPLELTIEVSALGTDAVLQGALATALDLARSEVFDKATHNPATLTAAPA